MSDQTTSRRAFAEELRVAADLKSDLLVDAFAKVPREHYLGPGPWNIVIPSEDGKPTYRLTESSAAEQTYRNVAIAIDPSRGLHNGHPEALAMWMDRLQLTLGQVVVHVGAGTGYYTAILAEMVGPMGRVAAFEIDPSLAARAKDNLRILVQVEVSSDVINGSLPEYVDAIFVTCGVTQIPLNWLEHLRIGGRLILPITASLDETGIGFGAMFLITHHKEGFSMQHISPAAFFPCIGARDKDTNERLTANSEEGWLAPRSVRLDTHAEDPTCWLHSDKCCLSRVSLHAAEA